MLFKKYFPPLLRVPQSLAATHHTAIDQNKAGRSHPPGPGYFLWVSPQHLNCQFNRPFPSCGHRSVCPLALPCLKLPGAAKRKNTKEITIKRAGGIGYFYFRKGDWAEKQLLTAYAPLSPSFLEVGGSTLDHHRKRDPRLEPQDLRTSLGCSTKASQAWQSFWGPLASPSPSPTPF